MLGSSRTRVGAPREHVLGSDPTRVAGAPTCVEGLQHVLEVLQHVLGSSRTRLVNFANTCLEVREHVVFVRTELILAFANKGSNFAEGGGRTWVR